MTAIQNRPAGFNYIYAPTARYQAPNHFAPVGNRRPVQAPPFHRVQPVRQQAAWGGVPMTPLQSQGAAYLDRPQLRTSIPMPVVTLLAAVVIIIAIAVGYWAA